jgi:DNA polymerase-3 subunit delta
MRYTHEKLFEDIDRGALKAVYFFYGPEELLKEQAVQAIIKKLVPPNLRDFNLDILYGDETDDAQIIDRVAALPMMAERRVVVVRKISALATAQKPELLKHLKIPLPHACLIMTAGEVDVRKGFCRSLQEVSCPVSFPLLKERQISQWVRQRVHQHGKDIDSRAAQLLADGFGSNLIALDNEIDKLAIYVAEREMIGPQDVEDVVGELRVRTVFEYCEAVGCKRLSQAMTLLNRLLDKGISPFNIMGSMRWHLTRLATVREMHSRGRPAHQIAASLHIPVFTIDRYVQQATNFRDGALEEAFEHLFEAELKLKTGGQKPATAMIMVTYRLSTR